MPENQAKIIFYCTAYCPYCVRAKSLLSSKKVNITEIDIDQQPEKFPEMIKKTAGITSVPQIFIGDIHVGGCDDLFALEAKSGLDKLLFPK